MSTPVSKEIFYPESDGKPMAESDLHRQWMMRIIDRLERFFAGQQVYVSGNLLVYYVEGDPKKCVAPDAFVVLDCEPRLRKIYKLWEEQKVPNFVLETTSSSTQREDLYKKTCLYAQLKIPEYFLFDPLGDWLNPPLLGYRLVGGGYVPLEPDDQGQLHSEQLGISLWLDEGRLAMAETATGKRLQTGGEWGEDANGRARQAEQRAGEAEQRLLQERAARQALEEELGRLRKEQQDNS